MTEQDNDVLQAIDDALMLLPKKMRKPEQRHTILKNLLAINLQEDPKRYGYQVVRRTEYTLEQNYIDNPKWAKGPARGVYQFEQKGGVRGVMRHRATHSYAEDLAEELGVLYDEKAIWLALEKNLVLASGFARLLLWTDPKPLSDKPELAFETYKRVWRPGAYTNGTLETRKQLQDKFYFNFDMAKELAYEFDQRLNETREARKADGREVQI